MAKKKVTLRRTGPPKPTTFTAHWACECGHHEFTTFTDNRRGEASVGVVKQATLDGHDHQTSEACPMKPQNGEAPSGVFIFDKEEVKESNYVRQ